MALEKYLQQYAEAEADKLPSPPGKYRQALVIPAYRESSALLDQLQQLLDDNHNTLVILVINGPDDAPSAPGLAASVDEYYPLLGGNRVGRYYDADHNSALLAVDRFSSGRTLPARQGVGLARKIGCDIACRLIHEGVIENPWIFSSDADVCWPADYFDSAIRANPGASALIYPFRHISEPGENDGAIQLYEFSLHYYVAGLRWAGSPYAYHTIGSTLAIHYLHYARVRGFPRRSGGEDFYILNKLAKSGPIETLRTPLLLIKDRPSDRVPFGTGPACSRIAALPHPMEQYPLYHPDCFSGLRRALRCMDRLASAPDSLHRWKTALQDAPLPAYLATLQAMGFDQALQHAAQHSSEPGGFSRHLHNWFDASRTLKFIHALRDNHYPPIGCTRLLQGDNFLISLLADYGGLPDSCCDQAQSLQACNTALREFDAADRSLHNEQANPAE
jgi:hypothetical protein